MKLSSGAKLLFIGDSITDCGRMDDAEDIGYGYVRHIRDYLQLFHSDSQVTVVNKGISGNTVLDLQARWQEDVISHHPDWVSISIGINDAWKEIEINRYEETYRSLIVTAIEKVGAKIILMETTVNKENPDSEENHQLIPYNEVIRRLAVEFDAALITLNSGFQKYLRKENPSILTVDGVHMNSAGNLFIAHHWLQECLLTV
ncbi:SGNH/GDSL hydrolase family protein [Paenibacillus sp. HWE-109]|uniref:SGNH/GDSL hydrolase family protein n=1 Tax=Paenibacillus sp. HWE-109 TaxID=1306526 RepID=UPI001EDE3638|nr:SGNH/GDSL hydrolase family protein [Paenibacillus sp. HWE-109]UKS28035.1 SGNH/GDSL hydrolase family protein [Paenibacillus sp. HWE-109]